MTILFSPDVCLPNDPAGWGRWLNGHAAEHIQMQQIMLNPTAPLLPFNIPDYDLLSWSYEPQFIENWLQTHQFVHDALDQSLNVTSVDFSLVNFEDGDENEFFIWLDDHRFTHAAYRQILGIT